MCWGFKRGQMNAICVEKKQTLSPFICVFVCRARTAANIPSKRQQASKTPAHRTRLNQKMWTKKLYDGMAISHPPFRPFSHQISILKDSFPQVMLCYVFTPWEKKSENLKQSKTKWWISKWRRWQERSQGRPLSGGPSPVRQCHRAPFSSSSSFGNLWGTCEQPF